MLEKPVLPLFEHLYRRIEELDLTEERFQGQQGALELMRLLENDSGFMDLVSLVGEVIVQGGWAEYQVHVNRNGFYLSYWYETPEPEIYPKEHVMEFKNVIRPVNAQTIKEGTLAFIRYAPWVQDSWLARGSARTGEHLLPVSTEYFPPLLRYPKPKSYQNG